MIHLDDELAREYLAECREDLATLETDLLAMQERPTEIDEAQLNRVFRAAHSVERGAVFFGLLKIRDLARQVEDALSLIRSRKMVPTRRQIGVLLRAADSLSDLTQNPAASNDADISELMAALAGLTMDYPAAASESCATSDSQSRPDAANLRMLLVEDDFASRLLLQTFLSRYGECHVAVNGREAVEAFRSSLEIGARYDLICMDIMMPEMDGREAVRQMRNLEEEHGILSTHGAKIIMTTAVDDIKEVFRCFNELCDAYLTKPIDLGALINQMRTYQLVQ